MWETIASGVVAVSVSMLGYHAWVVGRRSEWDFSGKRDLALIGVVMGVWAVITYWIR